MLLILPVLEDRQDFGQAPRQEGQERTDESHHDSTY
jgi:hypothetical protein